MNSIIVYTPGEIVSEIKLCRGNRNKRITYILVEGEADIKFYYNIVNKRQCSVKHLAGKENVLKAIEKIRNFNLSGAFGIVDSDFDNILNKTNNDPNICVTDVHDLETLSLSSGTFERFNNEYGEPESISRFERQNNMSVLDHIISAARKMGAVRLVNLKEDFHMDFSYIHSNNGLDRYIDKRTFSFDFETYIDDLINTMPDPASKESICELINDELLQPYDIWQICRGHDITSLISIYYGKQRGYNRGVGNEDAYKISIQQIERALRISYAMHDFEQTNLFHSILLWQTNNISWDFLQDKYKSITNNRLQVGAQ